MKTLLRSNIDPHRLGTRRDKCQNRESSSVFLLFNFTTKIVKVVIKRSKKSRNSNNINSSFGLVEYLCRALWACCMVSLVVSG